MTQLTIITGASSGIGASMAAQAEAAEHVVATVSRRPGPGQHLAADLADPASWPQVSAWVDGLVNSSSWDRVVFVHNAGTIDPVGYAGEVDTAAYTSNVMLNSASTQVLGERFIATMEDAGVPAQFQVISSGAGKRPFTGWSSYCAGKAAADMWVQCAGLERVDRGSAITVVSVGPGIVDTAMQGVIRDQDVGAFPIVEQFRGFKDEGALASPDDVASKLLALAACNAGDTLGTTAISNGMVTDVSSLA